MASHLIDYFINNKADLEVVVKEDSLAWRLLKGVLQRSSDRPQHFSHCITF